jgi:hypothetical protein
MTKSSPSRLMDTRRCVFGTDLLNSRSDTKDISSPYNNRRWLEQAVFAFKMGRDATAVAAQQSLCSLETYQARVRLWEHREE